MGKTFTAFFAAIMLVSCVAFGQNRMGFNLSYGTEIEQVGLGLNTEFFVARRFALSPGFTYYLPKTESLGYGDELKVYFWELNVDGHLYFTDKDLPTSVYGILGLNHFGIKAKFTFDGESFTSKDTDTGANIGLGFAFKSQNVNPFMEVKYETVFEGQFAISGGVRFPLN